MSFLRVKICVMKAIIFIVGLALAAGGLTLSIIGFTQIDSLDVTMLGLYLGGSFLLMTIGLYMMLVVFMKKKKTDDTDEKESIEEVLLDLDEDEDLDTEILEMSEPTSMIEDTMVLNLFEKEKDAPVEEEMMKSDDSSIEETSDAIESVDDLDIEDEFVEEVIELDEEPELIEEVSEDIEKINNEVTEEENLDQTLVSDEIVINSQEPVLNASFVEARLIGIEGFKSQRILKKLSEGTELTLRENQKHGLKSCEIFYQNKSIGYLSKVDYNKMADKLNQVYKITISTFVYENNKVATVMLSFMFKQ